jgi:hypothetical protein
MRRASLLLPLLVLAACDRSADKGTTLTLNSADGTVRGSADGGTGAVKLDLPGFKGEFKLPRIKLNADDFDLNGVHLYPGSTIETLDVQGKENAGNDGGQDGGQVRVAFSSPASPAKVRDWFAERLGKAGFTLRPDGQGLVGTDDDKKPFRMDLAADGADRAKGIVVLGD